MKLILLCKVPASNETNCPALYRTETGDYVVVGRRLPDTVELSAGIAVDEVTVLVLDGSLL